ncbi:MAG: cupredoxin domain-containing protein [Nanoarchaeota archaeon]|nr:cupredoxin domain-containing protein [Nanoarchaeota archaeon]
MEQKQLDELDESYFGEEFIDDDSFDDLELEDAPRASASEESDDDFDDIVIEDLASKSKTEKKVVRKVKMTPKAVKMERNDFTSGENSFYKEAKPAGEEKKTADSMMQKKKVIKESPKKELKSSAVDVSPTVNPWEGDAVKSTGSSSKSEKTDKVEKANESSLFAETSTWKAISAVVIVLLVFSVFTQGFHFSEGSQITTGAVAGEGAMAGKEITLAQAEKRVLDYVNQNLLRPPYVAELMSSAELKDVFKVTLSVSGQDVDSYLTKDGRYFFPQGFDISYAVVVETDEESADVTDAEDTELADTSAPEEVVTAPVNTEEEVIAGGAAREFTLTAKKWLFSPQELTVKSGEKVVLTIVPEGLEFTFAIPELGVEKQVSGTTMVEFTASKPGEFEFSCSSCESWRGMTGTLLVY